MSRFRKNATIVVSLLVIAVVAAWAVHRHRSLAQPPARIWEATAEKIDTQTYEVLSLSFGEWEKLGGKDGYYLNPKTKTHTMCDVITCAACGERIPRPPTEMDGMTFVATYRCPKCGKKAFAMR